MPYYKKYYQKISLSKETCQSHLISLQSLGEILHFLDSLDVSCMFGGAHSPPECYVLCLRTSCDISHISIEIGRYRCLKCLNFDICQACFFAGLHGRSHQKAHPVTEHCVQVTSNPTYQWFMNPISTSYSSLKTLPPVKPQILLLSLEIIFKTKEVANSALNKYLSI